MKREFIARHIKKLFRARAPHSLDATKEVLERLLEALDGLQDVAMEVQKQSKHSKMPSEALDACRT